MGNRGLGRRAGSRFDLVRGELQQSRDSGDTQTAAVVAATNQFCAVPELGQTKLKLELRGSSTRDLFPSLLLPRSLPKAAGSQCIFLEEFSH